MSTPEVLIHPPKLRKEVVAQRSRRAQRPLRRQQLKVHINASRAQSFQLDGCGWYAKRTAEVVHERALKVSALLGVLVTCENKNANGRLQGV